METNNLGLFTLVFSATWAFKCELMSIMILELFRLHFVVKASFSSGQNVVELELDTRGPHCQVFSHLQPQSSPEGE